MDKVWQLGPLFVTGFLASRIVARTGMAESTLRWFFRRSGGRFWLLLGALLFATIFLSLFIPNVLTVLALLPIIEKLGEQLKELEEAAQALMTPLVLTLIYGANIGGMGSLIGSPANAYMLVFLELSNVPGREKIDFLSWLLWGLPLVIVFGLVAWGLLLALLVPKKLYRLELELPERPDESAHVQHRQVGTKVSLVTAGFWLALSFVSSLVPGLKVMWDGLAVLFGIGFVFWVFRVPIEESDGSHRPLLRVSDCYTGLPWRGILLAGVAVGLSLVLFKAGVPKMLANQVQAAIPAGVPPFVFALLLILATTFTTEVISNTAASAALFPIAFQLAQTLGWHPLPAIMGVALASTCAFMSPLATPSTGLAFGSLKGVSLRKMLWLGFLTNVLGGIWLALLLTYVIPWFYGFPIALPR